MIINDRNELIHCNYNEALDNANVLQMTGNPEKDNQLNSYQPLAGP